MAADADPPWHAPALSCKQLPTAMTRFTSPASVTAPPLVHRRPARSQANLTFTMDILPNRRNKTKTRKGTPPQQGQHRHAMATNQPPHTASTPKGKHTDGRPSATQQNRHQQPHKHVVIDTDTANSIEGQPTTTTRHEHHHATPPSTRTTGTQTDGNGNRHVVDWRRHHRSVTEESKPRHHRHNHPVAKQNEAAQRSPLTVSEKFASPLSTRQNENFASNNQAPCQTATMQAHSKFAATNATKPPPSTKRTTAPRNHALLTRAKAATMLGNRGDPEANQPKPSLNPPCSQSSDTSNPITPDHHNNNKNTDKKDKKENTPTETTKNNKNSPDTTLDDTNQTTTQDDTIQTSEPRIASPPSLSVRRSSTLAATTATTRIFNHATENTQEAMLRYSHNTSTPPNREDNQFMEGRDGNQPTEPNDNDTTDSDNQDNATPKNDEQDNTQDTAENQDGTNDTMEATTETTFNPYRATPKRPTTTDPPATIHLTLVVRHKANHQEESRLPRVTETTLKQHIHRVLQHHRCREEPMMLEMHRIEFLETKQPPRNSNNRNNNNNERGGRGYTSSFHLTLRPAPINDAFDTEVFQEQGIRFVTQMWHKHHRDDFRNDNHGLQQILRHGSPQSNPTVNPRYKDIDIYAPACNNRTCETHGIIVGIPASAIKHKRGYIDLTDAIHDQLLGFLPTHLQMSDDFHKHIGCRDGNFSGDFKSKQRGTVPVTYISASSKRMFETILRAYNELHKATANNDLRWRDNIIQLIPVPKTQQQRTTTLEALRELDQYFSASVRIRLFPLNDLADDEEWEQLTQMENYQAAFPEFCHHEQQPIAFVLYLLRTPDTLHLTTTTIRQYPGFPRNILRQTMASVTAAAPPPRNNTSNDHQPIQANHTSRLLDLTRRIVKKAHPTTADDDENSNTRETRARSTSPGAPPPRKRPNQDNHHSNQNDASNADDTEDDPYDDGTDWKKVAEATSSLAPRAPPSDTSNTSSNQYAPLQDDDNPEAEYEEDRDRYDDRPTDVDMEDMDVPDEWDNVSDPSDSSRPLFQQWNSQHTTEELRQIIDFVASNNEQQLPVLEQYLDGITSFSTDTDAQDVWEYAERLVQRPRPTSSPSPVAGPRTGHVVPHASKGQGAL